jgi:hypothetical protein
MRKYYYSIIDDANRIVHSAKLDAETISEAAALAQELCDRFHIGNRVDYIAESEELR